MRGVSGSKFQVPCYRDPPSPFPSPQGRGVDISNLSTSTGSVQAIKEEGFTPLHRHAGTSLRIKTPILRFTGSPIPLYLYLGPGSWVLGPHHWRQLFMEVSNDAPLPLDKFLDPLSPLLHHKIQVFPAESSPLAAALDLNNTAASGHDQGQIHISL